LTHDVSLCWLLLHQSVLSNLIAQAGLINFLCVELYFFIHNSMPLFSSQPVDTRKGERLGGLFGR